MATFNIGDRVVYKNLAGRHAGVGVVSDLIGTTAKVQFDKEKPEALTEHSFYTYTDVKHLEHYRSKEEK